MLKNLLSVCRIYCSGVRSMRSIPLARNSRNMVVMLGMILNVSVNVGAPPNSPDRKHIDFLPRNPFFESIMPGSDGMPSQRGFRDVFSLEKMPRQDRRAPAGERWRKGRAISDPESMRIQHLRFPDFEEISGVGGGCFRIDRDLVCIKDVFRSKGLAVMPTDPLAQMESNHEPVCGNFP